MTEKYMKYTYNTLIPLQTQIWLATNTYKHSKNLKTLSATAFLKSTKSLILSGRAQDIIDEAVTNGDFSSLATLKKPDLIASLKSRIGTAIHDSHENAWVTNYRQAFKDLGYTDTFIDRIVLNPEPSQSLPENAIVVYTEKRLEREVSGYTVTGEADFIFDGVIQDLKTTSVFAFKFASDDKHTMQMSIYKWIFEAHGIKLNDLGQVNYLFTDWSKIQADRDPKYPPLPTIGVEVALKSSTEVQDFLSSKIAMIEELSNSPEEDMPPCTPEEVWQRESNWAYYGNPDKLDGRATNVGTYEEMVAKKNAKGTGVILERVGQVTFCNFCAGSAICKQKDTYIQAGLLEYTE